MHELRNHLTKKRRLESFFEAPTEGPIRESRIVVSIVMESRDQLAFMQSASDLLCDLEISHEVVVMSNYTQERVVEFTRVAQLRGLKVIVAGGAPEGDFFRLITCTTLLPVLEVAISPPLVGNRFPGSNTEESSTFANNRGSQLTFSAQKAAQTAAAIVALDDCHISERLRKWQELHTHKKLYR
jgi:phosphoribosylcarboxyaminoimidazole (NCAIR) mutase